MSIVALLVALLLPALGKAREAARRAACCSNLRQFGVVFAAYHADLRVFPSGNDRYYVITNNVSVTLKNRYNIPEALTFCPAGADFPSSIWPWGVSNPVYQYGRMKYFYYAGHGGFDETYVQRNGWLKNRYEHMNKGHYPLLNIHDVSPLIRPAIAPVMSDINYAPWAFKYEHQPQRSNHVAGHPEASEGQNMLMVDLHVSWHPMTSGVTWQWALGYQNRLWWTPTFSYSNVTHLP